MNGAKRVTVRRSAEEWRAIVSRFEGSGQTRKQFCTAENLAPSTFSLWRRKLRRSEAGSGANGAGRFVESPWSIAAPVIPAECLKSCNLTSSRSARALESRQTTASNILLP